MRGEDDETDIHFECAERIRTRTFGNQADDRDRSDLRIAHAMYYAKYIDELGTGITELLKKCREHGLKRPLLEESSGKFRIILWRRANAKVGRAESLRFELLVVEYLKTVGEKGATLSDLQQFAGALPRSTCQSSLRKLRKEEKIRMEGSTSAAKWFPVYQ